jgi:hypothetical protein
MATATETNTIPHTIEPQDGQTPFFNVMPEATKDGQVFFAPTPVEASDPRENADQGLSIQKDMQQHAVGKKRTAFILIPIIILLLAAGGYGVWLWQKDANAPVKEQPEVIETKPEETPEETETNFATTPSEWLQAYFGTAICKEENTCGDVADPDRDGLTNKSENQYSTDPNNNDSDSDGLADGDEITIFSSSPLKLRTAEDPDYTDAQYAQGGYDTATKKLYTDTRMAEIKSLLREHGLHAPTIATLDDALQRIYGFSENDVSGGVKPKGTQLPEGIDSTPEAKLDRDAQRLATIKKIGAALIKYKAATKSFPDTTDFDAMIDNIQPYLTSATNAKDPINQDAYVYGYKTEDKGATFVLSYYSETQSQLIRYKSSDAEKESQVASANTNDEQRMSDLEAIRSALLVYSASKTPESFPGNVFPSQSSYKSELVPASRAS